MKTMNYSDVVKNARLLANARDKEGLPKTCDFVVCATIPKRSGEANGLREGECNVMGIPHHLTFSEPTNAEKFGVTECRALDGEDFGLVFASHGHMRAFEMWLNEKAPD